MLEPLENDIYKKNLSALQQHQPQIWDIIANSPPEPMGRIVWSQNGRPNLVVANDRGEEIFFHDQADPEKDRAFIPAAIPENHCGLVAVLGMGLGYAALDILARRPNIQYLALFELEPGIFLQALQHVDLSGILADPRLILRLGSEPGLAQMLTSAARTIQLEDSRTYHHRPAFQLDPSGYQQLEKDLFTHINSLNIAGNTTAQLGRTFMDNRFEHLTTIHHNFLFEQLRGLFLETPAILVAGGPSLDKNIHLLKQAQEKAVIIAVDTVLPALLSHGIQPHFLTTIDPNNLTYEKIAASLPGVQDTVLICAAWGCTRIPKNFPVGQISWIYTGKAVEVWLGSLLEAKLFAAGASTVAHLNLIAANILGCDPIIFVGQDLAYPASSSHARHTVLQGAIPSAKAQQAGEMVMGTAGNLLKTNRAFLSMKKHFEEMIGNTPKTFINATEGGAHIEGTEISSLQEAIDSHCRQQAKISRRLQQHLQGMPPLDAQKLLKAFAKKSQEVKSLQKDVAEADRLSHAVLKALETGPPPRAFSGLPRPLQQKVQKIDLLHKKLDKATETWRILEEVTMGGLRTSARQRQHIENLDREEQYVQWLRKNIERLLDINKTRKEVLSGFEANLAGPLAFHRREKHCLKTIAAGKDAVPHLLKLARLYIDAGNYALALPIVEELQQLVPEAGEVFFFRGCIATMRSEYDKATRSFARATELTPALASDIATFHLKLAEEYLSFARYFKQHADRHPSFKYMLRKGLRFVPEHEELLAELTLALRKDLEHAQERLTAGNHDEAAPLVREWHAYLTEDEKLFTRLPPNLVARIWEHYGRIQNAANDFAGALESYQKGLHVLPDNLKLLTLLMETYFAAGDFNNGIATLERAIKIDKSAAAYWENLGEILQQTGRHEDAITAYGRCFLYLPANLGLLKKIGDCYLALGQLEAAKEAYEQLKAKLEKTETPTESVP